MKPSAVLLIDLENFYLSRIDYFNNRGIRVEERPSFAEDLKNLVRHAHRMAGLPFAVRRAYADFESLRVEPQDLMRQGVEPVQVFRLSGKSANKNAADMKLAMDAVALLGAGAPVEHFVLVSGDADFIPVILELKRRGHTVSVIAVTGATNDLIQRFADKFELFESLGRGADQVTKVNGTNGFKSSSRSASGTRAVPVERLALPQTPEPHTAGHYKHLLASGRADANEARVLTVPWESLVWVCDAVVPALAPPTGSPATSMDLMSRLQTAARATDVPDLASHVALVHSAVRCSLPVPSVPGGVYVLSPETTGEQIRRKLLRYVVYVLNCRLSENGVKGPIRAEAVAAMFDPGPAAEQVTAEVTQALAEPELAPPTTSLGASPKPPARADDVHTPDGYRKLLQKGGTKGTDTEHMRVHHTPWPSVERVCADTFTALFPGTGGAGALQRGQFLERLYAAEEEMCLDNYRSHVRRAFAVLGLSHAILEDGERVTLHPDVTEPGHIRWAVLGIMLKLLAIRLEEKGLAEPVRPDTFVAAIEAGPFTNELLPEIANTILSMYQAPDDDELVLIPEPAASAEETVELGTVEPANETEQQDAELAPGADPFAFDGAILEHAPTTTDSEAVLELAPGVSEAPTSEVVDVSAITSEAVAAVVEPAVRVFPAAEPPAPAPSVLLPVPSEPELVVFAPLIEGGGAPEVPEIVPVADWVPDDVLFPDLEFGAERVTERLTGGSSPPHPSTEMLAPADKITPPPQPPSALLPLPPLPPESA
ncbi:NYN domain-containing protein [Gemmata sp. G18]|uniref:NYN domain-containing protein n=1 Tax=Gemmata palustris TaxID=2822762 RepID=A0ABS5BMI0_9BACT|nr:NYN domain-containing protein [Gemmata palustris]MBP3954485.1 NYN domain-containing protein [Gemmata palustris]